MSEKELYTELLRKMVDASDNFNRIISTFDDAKNKLTNGINISGNIYNNDEIKEIRDELVSKRDILNNTIIPSIQRNIEML